jgi:uncharacterized protein (TIGR00290 family)
MKGNAASFRQRALMCWSGGKDSAMALHALQQDPAVDVAALLTTLTEGYDRISMHGVRRELLQIQADRLGLPLRKVYIPQKADNAAYEAAMGAALQAERRQGARLVAFGDIFLEDLRAYRERNLARLGLKGLFPLWKRNTAELARAFVRQGFKAVVVCVDTRALDPSFAGRDIDDQFLADLPRSVDPCGENGEFHSFVYDGPIFGQAVSFTRGQRTVRDVHFCFCDILPADRNLPSPVPASLQPAQGPDPGPGPTI